jgi:ATP-dependent DNA helicase DinG
MEEVQSEMNPYKEYEFLYKSRKKMETANIVVINHAILFAESKKNGDVFQSINNLIIDEAHNLEDVAT